MTVANGFRHESEAAAALRRCGVNVVAAFALLAQPARSSQAMAVAPRRVAIVAAVSLALVLACIALIDRPVARAVAHFPDWIVWPFGQITDFGMSGWVLWPLSILFLAMAALPEASSRVSQAVLAAVMVRVGFLLAAVAVPGIFVSLLKRIIGRARPNVIGHIDPFLFAPFRWHFEYASMPSGHATTVFSVLVAFGTLWPRARTALLLYAMVISVSRIMVMAHYPSDILAGAIIGTVGALMVRRYFALRRLAFSVGPDGATHQLPGPSLARIKAVARDLLAP